MQGLAQGLGIAGPVRSPSYNILKRYSDGRWCWCTPTCTAPAACRISRSWACATCWTARAYWPWSGPGVICRRLEEMPSINVSFSFPAGALPGHERDEERRNLEFIWQADCPPAITAVLHALASR